MSPDAPAAGFYAELEPCDSFDTVGDLSRFRSLPPDWSIVISDIRDSTPAIEAGRYKDVNMIGAATIVAAINAAPDVEVPFVFGGDGATLAVPASVLEAVVEALMGTRGIARDSLDLDLRVGVVPMAAIRERGRDVLVAKLRVSPGNHLALFAGGGVGLADDLIKADEDGSAGFSRLETRQEGLPDLTGLSCRWEPLESTRGHILSLLVRARSQDVDECARVYREVIARLDRILDSDPLSGRPVRDENMRFRWPPRGLGLEASFTRRHKSRARRLVEVVLQSLVQFVCETFDLDVGDYDAPSYRAELRANTDHRRFDGTLRVVADCTDEELASLRELLVRLHAEGTIFYGLWVTHSALMTCLVFDLAEKRHLHFLDGSDGGFTLAAKGLKAQIAAASVAVGDRPATDSED